MVIPTGDENIRARPGADYAHAAIERACCHTNSDSGCLARHFLKRLNGRQVYLCFDMDFFDPSCAPGVCTPTWGGASAREGLSLLQGLAGLNIVAVGCKYSKPTTRCGRNDSLFGGNCHVGVYGSCLSEFTDHLLMVRHSDRR